MGNAEALFGWHASEVLGKRLDEFGLIHPDDSDVVRTALNALKLGNSSVVQNRNCRKDGTVVYCEWYNSAIIESPGELVWGFSLALDVTARHQMEEALRANQQRLVSIYNTVGDIIFHLAVEPEGQFRFVSVNAAFLRTTGLKAEDIIGKTVNEVVPEPSLTLVLRKYRQVVEEKTIVRWEETSDYPSGRLTGEVSVAPVLDNHGHCTHLVGSVHDMTERKQAQELLRASEEKFRNIFEAAPVGIFQSTVGGRFLSANPRLAAMFGYESPEALIRSINDVTTENYVNGDQRREVLRRINETKQYVQAEVTYRRRDGSHFICNLYMRAVNPDDPDSPLEGFNEDITERKRAEEALREAHLVLERRVAERTAELRAKNSELEREIAERERIETLLRSRNEELKAFAYTVSHDLKAPLRGIAGYAQELDRRHQEGLSERALFCLTQILTATRNLDHLIEDLLHYSRLDSETPTHIDIDLTRVVDAILQERKPVIVEQNVTVQLKLSAIHVCTWERGLLQVLANLIDNALKYSRNARPPCIRITSEELPDKWRIAISDNGIGFDMEYHDRIFGLFNRLVRQEEFEGTGAGLAIAKKVAEKLGGRIWAESAPQSGAQFFLELPKRPLGELQ